MLSSVSTTPAINCSPVLTTSPLTFSAGNNLYWWQRSVGQGPWYCHWKRRKGTLHPLIIKPWGCQNYFKPKWHYLVLAASGVSDQDVWGVYGWNFSWWFQWHRQRPCSALMAGDITNILLSLAAPHLHGVLVIVTAINLLLVRLSPGIIVHRCCCHWQWIYCRWRCHWRYLFTVVIVIDDEFIAVGVITAL